MSTRLSSRKSLFWVDRDGTETPVGAPVRNYNYADLSPDGRLIALDLGEPENDIWIWDVERGSMSRLTFDAPRNLGIAWSPDSRDVAFNVVGAGIALQAADGSGAPRTIGPEGQPSDIAADGALIYSTNGAVRDIYRVAPNSGNAGEPLLANAASERNASVSPNGDYIAYQSDESGRLEVYVRTYPDIAGGRWQISTDGGTRPIWRADGQRFLTIKVEDDSESHGPELVVVQNWLPRIRRASEASE